MDSELGSESTAGLGRNETSSLPIVASASDSPGPPVRRGRRQGGLHSLAWLVAAMLLLAACTGSGDNDATEAATPQTAVPTEAGGPVDTTDSSTPGSTSSDSSVVAVSDEPLNRGGSTEVFALVELSDGGRGVAFGSSLEEIGRASCRERV